MTGVRYEVRDGVGEIVLSRPERLNAFDTPMVAELGRILDDAAEDDAVGALLLTGEGRGFCAGLDLTSVQPPDDGRTSLGAVIRDEMERSLGPVVRRLVEHRVPVVTAVNGVAAGGGMGLALAGDIVIAARSASFLQVFAPRLGIAPDTGSTWLLPRLVGRTRARGLTLLGDPLDAETAADWGLVWQVVDDGDLLRTSRTIASRLAAGPTEAFRRTRELLDRSVGADLGTQLTREAEANGALADGPGFVEGIAAFLEKREPRFPPGS